ncbi:MAG TPA: helix-turn-helix transcriptional regulator [Clostridiaceae bacterium]|nr:helix-turn-helix transcriptional regulator [Clostridiaceae bacterium]
MSTNSYFSYKKLLKKLIDEDMSNKDLMERADISRSTFYKIKNSENVTTETLLRICDVLDCDISEIMERGKK